MRILFKTTLILAVVLMPLCVQAQSKPPVYREPNQYPILDEIQARRDAAVTEIDSLKQIKQAEQDAVAEAAEAAEMSLRVDWSDIQRPAGPEAFNIRLPHLPPTPQFYTGTCWAFCSTSFMESEVIRQTGQEIKLSEMWTVYWEYVEKVRRFVREYGESEVEEGGQSGGLLQAYAKYGAVPKSVYKGVLFDDERHDHTPMLDELKAWLATVAEQDMWDEDLVVAGARLILDAHMGPPPAEFEWSGRNYTPRDFLDKVLKLKMNDYVNTVSRMNAPFNTYVLLDVTDNWRRSETYLNLPLDTFTQVIRKAVKAGYTVDIGGDNSEPGVDGLMDAAVIPEWDIPSQYINQGSREFRIDNGTTSDDHGIHIVGYTMLGGREWYLIKDSNRSSRLGEHKGYYFFDADYVKLKMLSFMVHKDMLEGMLP